MNMVSRDVRKKRAAYEEAMMFEGTVSFVRAVYMFAKDRVDSEMGDDACEQQRDCAMDLCMGSVVRDMWNDVASKGLTYDEYRERAENALEEVLSKAEAERKRKEEESAEESGYRIVR